jgi:hypothetical protein
MPGEIHIDKIYYANPTGASQTFKFEYKLWSAPESGYINIGNSAINPATGVLSTPLQVTGLPSNTLYYIRSTNLSCSPGEIYIQQYTTD